MRRRDFVTVAAATTSAVASRPASAAAGSPIGFALGSGALHRWAHIGIVRGCARIGLQPFAIAGCNAGAAVGALWAAGLAADEITRIAHRFEWQPSDGTLALLVGGRRRNDALREERRLGAQRIVAVDVAYRPHEEAPSSSSDYAFQAVHIPTNALARAQTRQVDHLIKLDLHHLMRKRLDVDALIDAGEAALMQLAPALLQK